MDLSNTVPQRQRGLGLLEVLVALVVISLGVLGMASLQLTGMKHSSSGYSRSKALLLAENMATRMRINQPAVFTMDYAGFDSDAINCTAQPAPYCQTTSAAAAASCTSAELAQFDLYSVACGDWGTGSADQGAKGALPEGRLQVRCDAASCLPTSPYAIEVSWSEGRTTEDRQGELETKRVQVRLRP